MLVADDDVVCWGSRDIFDLGQLIHAPAGVLGLPLLGQVDGHARRGLAVGRAVDARAAVQHVAPRAAHQEVIAGAAFEGVVPRLAAQDILPVAAEQAIVPVAAAEGVVAGHAGVAVGPRGPGVGVIAGRAGGFRDVGVGVGEVRHRGVLDAQEDRPAVPASVRVDLQHRVGAVLARPHQAHVGQADKGCDFDFLKNDFGRPVDEPVIY